MIPIPFQLAASVKFLVPFSLLTELGNFAGRHETPAPVSSSLPYVIQQASQPFTPAVLHDGIDTPAASTAVNWIPAALFALWIIGAAILSYSWWRLWRNLRAAMRRAAPLDLDLGIPTLTSHLERPSENREALRKLIHRANRPSQLMVIEEPAVSARQ
jgi:hypothetical protein